MVPFVFSVVLKLTKQAVMNNYSLMLEMLKNTQNVIMNVLRYFIMTYVKITSTKSEHFSLIFHKKNACFA